MAFVSDPLIPLRGGFSPRASVVLWLLQASDRLTFRIEPDGALFVGPRAATTPDDLAFIRRHRDEILACVRYSNEQDARPS
jgi:hypothetical protein